MTFLKVNLVLLIAQCLTVQAQFLTPDQLREQHDIGYGARTHYEMSGTRLTDMFGRVNPDYLFRGFFPFWSVILIGFAMVFLFISVIGLVGYLLGCRRPTREQLQDAEFAQMQNDDELLLGVHVDNNGQERKPFMNGYIDNTHSPKLGYDSRPERPPRTRIGQSDEDMV